jgi:DNA-binding PadR family transcriptional regulator
MARIDAAGLLPLPPLWFYILLALSEGEAHGWAIIKRIRELTAGQSDPSSGSLYLGMVRLEEQGLLEECAAKDAGTDPRRRYYRLTAFGRKVARAEAGRMARLVEHARRRRLLPHSPGGQ